MAVSLGLAVVLIFFGGRFRPYIDRLFFKERVALQRALTELPERFAGVRHPDELWALAGETLVSHLNPSACAIFTHAGDDFVAVFSMRDAAYPDIPLRSPLADWIRSLREATRIDRRVIAGVGGRSSLDAFDDGVVVTVQRAGALEAFICLGEKRSGDIYTTTDLALLTALAKSMSTHMMRFDSAELLERAVAMQSKMRRYVPGAVAEAIARGENLETGEREVSVLFVDIRGYTAMTQDRRAEDVFSLVNRYTETVSTIVKECGGVVVEFNGDGMMAVFGAPIAIDRKEECAVSAAMRLADTVPKMVRRTSGTGPVSVGIGVATGTAFVGNIEAADRTIWSAIGSTTNLAARLQTLTRELNTGVLIDATTFERAGGAASAFDRHDGVMIRGRREAETVFGLSVVASAPLYS